MFKRVAVVGAGSLGTIIGARLNAAGIKADLVDSFQENVDALNEHGATVTGNLDMKNIPVRAYTPQALEGIYDLILLVTKQTANEEILRDLLPHLDDSSLVLTLQNGIPEYNVAKIVGEKRTAGGAVGWGATWVKPGVSSYTSTMYLLENAAFDIGEMDGKITERIQAAAGILDHVGKTHVMDNLLGIRWAKLLMNATFSGMSAAMGSLFGDVLDDPFTLKCIAHIADETVRCSQACGIRMALMQGDKDFETLKLDPGQKEEDKFPLFHEVWDQHRLLKASMLQDLEKGRPCEIDFINGVVCETGRQKGIPTPFNDMVVKLIKRQQQTGKLNTMADKAEFEPLFK